MDEHTNTDIFARTLECTTDHQGTIIEFTTDHKVRVQNVLLNTRDK